MATTEGPNSGRRNESTGQVESLWGRIRASEMGSRATRERPAIGALPTIGGRKQQSQSLVKAAAAAELFGTNYRPRTKETAASWEFLLAFIAGRVDGEQRDVLAAAAEESLVILKDEELRDLEKKEKVGQILGPLDTDSFAQLINLSKRITDFAPTGGDELTSGPPPNAGDEEDDDGVAVVFEEEEETGEQMLPPEEEDEEEIEAALASVIPIVKLGDGIGDFKDEQDEDFVPLPTQKATEASIKVEEEPQIVDLESLAFAQGGHTMTNKRCVVPEKSVKISKRGYEEIHIPAPTPKPLGHEEKLIPVETLPTWAQLAFSGITSLNRIQSRLCRTALDSDENFLLCAPTGAGKTNVAILAMLREISKHLKEGDNSQLEVDKESFKIVYIAPMKALVQEMVNNFRKRLASYGLIVSELTGDATLTREQVAATQVLVTTPEKWDIITRKNNDTSYTRLVRLVIIDEIHLLHDDRGPVLEAIVARTLRQSEMTQQWTRLVGLSATLPNYADVGRFLRVEARKGIFYFDASFRPCPLAQQFVGITERKPLQRMQLMNTIAYEKVMERAGSSQILIFVHSRKDTAKTAKTIRDMAITNGTVGTLLRESAGSRDVLTQVASATKNSDLQDLLPYGFALHHAGMSRDDRHKVEQLFSEGHVQVLVSTATLAWGVNLPAHTVIIKGTQVYNPEKGQWCELSAQDVLQMLGRAGRPQYDTQGEGIIITTQTEMQFYLSLLNQQLPIESQLISRLVDHLNAEIVLGTVKTRVEAVEWLKYTYLFVRMQRDPSLYGVSPEEVTSDPQLFQRRSDLIHSATTILETANLVRYDRRTGVIKGTEQGRIASHYYIGHASMATYNQHLRPGTTGEAELCRVFALSQEFRLIPVRQEEKAELARLAERVPLPIREGPDEPAAKINILLQAYISRLTLEGFSLAADMIYVTQSAGRILRALFELCLRRGWARVATRALELCQMVEKRQWRSMIPLRQLQPALGLSADLLRKLERKDFPWERLFDLNALELGELIRTPAAGKTLYQALCKFPRVKLHVQTVPLTKQLLRVDLTITLAYEASEATGPVEAFWIMIEDGGDGETLLHVESIAIRSDSSPRQLTIYVPLTDPRPPAYFVTVVADRWLGSITRLPIVLMEGRLVLPEGKSTPTEPTTQEPLSFAEAFSAHPQVTNGYGTLGVAPNDLFDEVATTVFGALFKSDENVFIGCRASAKPGGRALVFAEFAFWRTLIQYSTAKCVYVVPEKVMLAGILERWTRLFSGVATIAELTGDGPTDLKILDKKKEENNGGLIILTKVSAFEQLTRRWRTRKTVQSIRIVVTEGLHMLSSSPLLEVVLSRARFMGAQLPQPVRIIGLSAPVWNVRELSTWLGVTTSTCFNFDVGVGVGTVALQTTIGSTGAAFVGPAWRATVEAGKALLYVTDDRQAREMALEFSARYAGLLKNSDDQVGNFANTTSNTWLEDSDSEVTFEGSESIRTQSSKSLLAECAQDGVAFIDSSMEAGLVERILLAFNRGDFKMLLIPKEMVWSVGTLMMPMIVPLIIILGTQEYSRGQLVDYPLSTLLALTTTDPGQTSLVLCGANRKSALTILLEEAIPVESALDTHLADTLNAEIAVKSITSRQDAVDYLTWSCLYRRLVRNPNYYGLAKVGQRALSEYLSELVENCLNELSEAKCIQVTEVDDTTTDNNVEEDTPQVIELTSLNLGLIAAYYGVRCVTVEMLALSLNAETKIRGIIECVAAAAEFDELPVRDGEMTLLKRLHQLVPYRTSNSSSVDYTDPHVKADLLIQAHLTRLRLPPALDTDRRLMLPQVLPIVQAAVDVLGSYGFLDAALAAMEFSQMIVQALWPTDPPIKQVLNGASLSNAVNQGFTSVYDLDENFLHSLKLPTLEQRKIAQAINRYPSMDVQFGLDSVVVPVGEDFILRAVISHQVELDGPIIAPYYPVNKEEAWWLLIGVPSTGALLGIKRFVMNSSEASIVMSFSAPETIGQLSVKLYLISDCYIGVDQEFDQSLFIEPALLEQS